jgi:pSer/pThr/pTyr-binding forkhead associated (FHA) protein
MDPYELATRSNRERFVNICRFPFLVSEQALVRPRTPQRTIDLAVASELLTEQSGARKMPSDPELRPLLLPVRKVHEGFENMITLGRTANNDLVVSDVQVSKFHAWFRIKGNVVEVCDAGSRNGTYLNDVRIEPKVVHQVSWGTCVRFASVSFNLLDAAGCWDYVHRQSQCRSL